MKPKFFIFGILFFVLVASSLAIDYGDGDYGAGTYGTIVSSGDRESSGGGEGAFVDNSISEIIIKESVSANTPVMFDMSNPGLPVSSIVLTSDSALSNVKLKVVALSSKPIAIDTPSNEYIKTYKYLDIQKTNIANEQISGASITFSVNKTWLRQQNLMDKNIVLLRWNNPKWNELETTILESNTENVVLVAKTPGFSYFAIALKNSSAIETSAPVNPILDVNTQPEVLHDTNNVNPIGNPQISLQNSSELITNTKNNILPITLATTFSIILFVIIVISTLHLWRKKKLTQEIKRKDRVLSEKDKTVLIQYIEKARQAKMTDEQIAQNLRKARLSEEQIRAYNVHTESMIKK